MAKNEPKNAEDLFNEEKKSIDGFFESTKKTLEEDIKIVGEKWALESAKKAYKNEYIRRVAKYILDKTDKLADSLGYKPKKWIAPCD